MVKKKKLKKRTRTKKATKTTTTKERFHVGFFVDQKTLKRIDKKAGTNRSKFVRELVLKSI